MYPVSAAFKTAVRGTHRAVIRAEIWRNGSRLRTLEVDKGSVEIDSRRAQRRTCTVEVAGTKPVATLVPTYITYAELKNEAATYGALKVKYASYSVLRIITDYSESTLDDGLIPTNAFSDVSPFGNEIALWRGIRVERNTFRMYYDIKSPTTTYGTFKTQWATYGQLKQPTGTEEYDEEVPLGVFVITEVNIDEAGKGVKMEIHGVDRSIHVQKAAWIQPYGIASGTNLATAIAYVLTDRYPDVQIDFEATSLTLPTTVLGLGGSNDPWADAQRLALAGGKELFFDGTGVCVLRSIQDPSEVTPVETYLEDEEAMILGVKRRISTDATFNGVVVTAEGSKTKPPLRVAAFDEDPASPTYRYGPFGDRPTFISSPTITSVAMASTVAVAQLAKVKGAEENVDWSQICDPSIDAEDVISIENTGTRLSKIMMIDKVTIPLDPKDTMSATARTVRVA